MKATKVFSRIVKAAYKANPAFYYVMLFKALFSAAVAFFNIYSLKIILDSAVSQPLKTTLIYAAIVVAIDVGAAFLNRLFERMINYHYELTDRRLRELTSQKLMAAPFSFLEDPYYLDLKERAKFANENQGASRQILFIIGNMLTHVVVLIVLASLLASFDWWLILVLFGFLIITVFGNFLALRFVTKFYQSLIPLNRRYGYYITVLSEKQKAKEYRLNDKIGSLMFNKFVEFNHATTIEMSRFSRNVAFFTSMLGIVNYLQTGLVYFLVAFKTIRNGLTAGTFSLFVSGSIAFATNAAAFVNDFMQLGQVLSYLKPWAELMDLPEEQIEGKVPFGGKVESLEFDHVSFSYPRTKNEILKDISFKVNKGERISIVGLNGAGKTTLIKLICRLYHPTQGTIKVNGVDIFEYDYKTYMDSLASVFQDFRLFAYSLEENITGQESDGKQASEMASLVGLKEKIDALPLGIKSRLSKEYDKEGIELSGGQTQKVAIARALYKNASLVILDEPTSALDPLAEADIYQRFNELVVDKTAIFISHRLSSSVFCDRVLLIQDGHSVDFDTHANLMKKRDSLYFKMFTAQAKNYQID